MDPDQTGLKGEAWSESVPFAIQSSKVYQQMGDQTTILTICLKMICNITAENSQTLHILSVCLVAC